MKNQAYLQAEQRHSDPFQETLKLRKAILVLKWFGKMLHRVAAANLRSFGQSISESLYMYQGRNVHLSLQNACQSFAESK